jgi:hypothetical protein
VNVGITNDTAEFATYSIQLESAKFWFHWPNDEPGMWRPKHAISAAARCLVGI